MHCKDFVTKTKKVQQSMLLMPSSHCIVEVQITGKVLGGSVKPGNRCEEVIWEGMHCISLSLRGSCIELSKAIEVMKQLAIFNPKKVISSSLPYHEKLIESCIGHSNDDKLPCRLCNKKIDSKFMRCHVGYHIINEEVQNVCGFCGLQSCSIWLKMYKMCVGFVGYKAVVFG